MGAKVVERLQLPDPPLAPPLLGWVEQNGDVVVVQNKEVVGVDGECVDF
jgi:hypothetical protein